MNWSQPRNEHPAAWMQFFSHFIFPIVHFLPFHSGDLPKCMRSQFKYFIKRVITFTKVGKQKGKEINLAVLYGEGAAEDRFKAYQVPN